MSTAAKTVSAYAMLDMSGDTDKSPADVTADTADDVPAFDDHTDDDASGTDDDDDVDMDGDDAPDTPPSPPGLPVPTPTTPALSQPHDTDDNVAGRGAPRASARAKTEAPKTAGSGRGKSLRNVPSGGKGRAGKSVSGGKGVRHRALEVRKQVGPTKASLRKLARRGGVKRLSSLVYADVNDALRSFMTKIVGDSIYYMEHAGRKTVSATDVIFALKRNGRTLYGFV